MNDVLPGDDWADDLTTLFPEQELEIKGETVTVRPISFLEGMRLGAAIQPLVDDIGALFESGDAEPQLEDILRVFINHEAIFIKLESLCSNKSEEWVKNLDDSDGWNFALTFWTVNSNFFIRRLLAPKLNQLAGSELSSSENSLQH